MQKKLFYFFTRVEVVRYPNGRNIEFEGNKNYPTEKAAKDGYRGHMTVGSIKRKSVKIPKVMNKINFSLWREEEGRKLASAANEFSGYGYLRFPPGTEGWWIGLLFETPAVWLGDAWKAWDMFQAGEGKKAAEMVRELGLIPGFPKAISDVLWNEGVKLKKTQV